MVKNLFFLFFILVSCQIIAQDQPEQKEIITDRPDQTESPSLIAKGFLQVESGIFYQSFEESEFATRTTGYNTSLFRYGLLENLEFRLGIDVQEINTEFRGQQLDRKNTGITPLLLGAKIGIAKENNLLPEIGFLGHLYLPFAASSQYRPETTGVDLRFAFSHSLSEKSGLAYNIGAQWRDDSPEATYIFTLSFAYDVTPRLGVFAEYFSDLPEGGNFVHSFDGGLTYALKPNIQLDAYAGKGITENSFFLMGAGISFRIPK